MISIENSPSDPSTSSRPCVDQNHYRNQDQSQSQIQIPQLITSNSCSDEKKVSAVTTSDNKLAFVEEEKKEEEVDLLKKSSLDDSNPLPQFSIRDYVFSSRSKDISRNWPFSEESLDLCLKHGVTNLLPPFQPLDSLKNPTVNRSVIERSLFDCEVLSSCDADPFKQTYQFVPATSDSDKCNPVLALDPGNKTPKSTELVAEPELGAPPASQKTESTIQSAQIKKCRLVVKFSPLVEPGCTSEDILPNNFMVSETMASKVCPVCKTFSSSSNTTLNAHIDQCLSGESNMKWTANSKVIKNRVKPRKMRLMVDIYKTAPYCTLEELDKRNGTNWATNSNFPSQEIEFHGEEKEKEQRGSSDIAMETGHEGDVYIDTNGTKVRILSVAKRGATDDHGSRKLLKGKGSKLLTSKKGKKTREEKQHKFLKLSPRSKKFSSPKPRRGFEMQNNHEENFSVEEGGQKEDRQKQHFQAHNELEFDDDRGTIKPWVCSRRSGHTKKDSRYNVARNLTAESSPKSLEKRRVTRTPSSSDNQSSSSESSKGTDSSPYEPLVDDYREKPLLRKKVGFRSGSSASNKVVEMINPSNNTHDSPNGSNARVLSSLKKNLLSVNQESMPESSSNLKRKIAALQNTRLHVRPSQVDRLKNPWQDSSRHQSRMHDVTEKTSLGGLNVMETRKKRGGIKFPGKEEAHSMKHLRFQAREKIDSSVQLENVEADTLGEGESSGKDIETNYRSLTVQPNSRTNVGGNFLNPEFASQLDSQQCIEVYQRTFSEAEGLICSRQPSADKDKVLCRDDRGETMTGQNICDSADSDSKEMGHGDYFTDVEPIPIPGPPGSFLPSPGADMVSEDLQGNSSLTNSRVQSSEDRLDLVDRDSMSNSPISATSTISNPTLSRSNSRCSEKNSVRPVAVGEDFSLVRRAANVASERPDVDDWRANATFPEKGPTPVLKSDQPCCCSRKECMSQSVASNYQESALLRRRAMEMHKRQAANTSNFKPETFCHSNYPPEKVFLPAAENSHGRHLPMTPSADCAASPSSSNPVLRLMGKDLMVVKNDEDVAPQLGPPQSSSMKDHHPNRQFLSVQAAASPGNLQNEDYHSFHQVFPLYGHNHNDLELQHIDFRGQTQQTPIHALERPFTNTTMLAAGDYMTSADHSYGLGGSHPRKAPIHSLDICTNRYDSGAFLARDRNVFPNSNNPMKEIIIIDDSPENEADLATHAMHNGGGLRRNQAIPIHFTSGYNPRHMNNSFYNNQSQSQVSLSYVGTPVVDNNGSFPRPVSREVINGSSPAKWNCLPEGSVRSTMYYPPPPPSFS